MNIKQILKNAGLEESVVNSLAETINAEIPKEFVKKEQYNKKVQLIDSMQEKINDFEAKAESINKDEYKDKYEALVSEFDQYKADIQNKETRANKSNLLNAKLKESGVTNPKLISLLSKEFDLDKIEIEDNNIKDWDNILNPIKESYSDFFETTGISGAEPTKPPVNNPTSFTKSQIEKMSTEEINKNWDVISKSLSNI